MRDVKVGCLIFFSFAFLLSIVGCKKMDWEEDGENAYSSDITQKDSTKLDGLRIGSQTHPYVPSDIVKCIYPSKLTEDIPVICNDIWVCGYVVGYVDGTRINSFVVGVGGKESNIVLSDSYEVWNTDNLFPVQLSKSPVACSKVRDMLNLSAHPENLFKRVKVKGNVESYMGVWGMKNTSDAYYVE